MSNFDFLKDEFPILYNTALAAEYNLHEDLKAKTYNLAQAILQKAFKVQLSHQDSNDELASVLLERIKGGRMF